MAHSDEQSTSIQDVKQLGLFAAIGSLSYVFWVVGGMEMVERCSYYGVKAVAALYAKEPVSQGGLGIEPIYYGVITSIWAFVQTFLPIFTGGLSDRYGYKLTIFVSTIVKIIGYLMMALMHSFWGFLFGAIVLAIGTAIFKPGIQGTLVKATTRRNSSVAWSIFYQTVNIGGYLGPIVAAMMRNTSWQLVFFTCAGIIALNFLLLLTYREVGKVERLEQAHERSQKPRTSLVIESLRELRKPHLYLYLLIFSGFWFMFNALFDVLPMHIDDWVNTRDIVQTLFHNGQTDNTVFKFLLGMNDEGTVIKPEGLVNLNAGLIMLTCFLFGYFSGLMRATTSMVVGTLLATLALFGIGGVVTGWAMAGVIVVFSVGEMLSSPKFSEFIGNFAPRDKKAMYLGFSQMPLAIGWTLEGLLGPALYGMFASKDKFSRDLLLEKHAAGETTLPEIEQLTGMAQEFRMADGDRETVAPEQIAELYQEDFDLMVERIPNGEAFDWLVALTNQNAATLQQTLYETHNIGLVWYLMGAIGIASAACIFAYGQWIKKVKIPEND